MSTKSKLAAAPALVAAFAMSAGPLEARVMPASAPAAPATASSAGEALSYHRHYRYRRGPSVGDVLAGVLIIGGIAAVANAATRKERYRDRDRPYPQRRSGWDYDDARTIDRAVESCVRAVERDVRVESVDRVDRTERGWDVRGSLYDGKGFTCSLGRDGRIESLDYAGRRDADRSYGEDADFDADDSRARSDDRQYDDDRYARERARQDDGGEPVENDVAEAPQPSYPGGPVPEEGSVDEGPEYPGDAV